MSRVLGFDESEFAIVDSDNKRVREWRTSPDIDALTSADSQDSGRTSCKVPVDPSGVVTGQLSNIGSTWFTTGDAEDIARMAEAETLDPSHFVRSCLGQ